MYRKYIKRLLDIVLSLVMIVVLLPVYLILILVGSVKMKGNPFFIQPRPGMVDPKTGQERIYRMIKFRSMTCECDQDGKLLPDEQRLTKYGMFIRKTSLDELPEFFQVFTGKMSLVGPRPQLVRDMVFMTEEQRRRHLVRPGITGLAQINGRNCIKWEDKLAYDMEYVNHMSLLQDLKIMLITVVKIFKTESISYEGMVAEDFGDYLLRCGQVTREEYDNRQKQAEELLRTSGSV
ncbi:MAG: sugar transferase [Lachnospiraceae bacterium]|nr:sugar transferase [Lachnospiraceae bacterium]